MSLSQKFPWFWFLSSLGRFMGPVCCVFLSSLDLGQQFLELGFVITLISTGISPQDVKVDALARLVHLRAEKRESLGAQNVNVCDSCKSQYLGYLGWGTGARCVMWCFVSSPKTRVGISWSGPRKSRGQSLKKKKTKTICLKQQRANILIRFNTSVNPNYSLFLF